MNRMDRSVRRDGHPLELTVKEFALLEFMLQRRGKCCTRSELLREVWQMSPDAGTNVVDVYINYLRKKLAAAHPDGHIERAGDRDGSRRGLPVEQWSGSQLRAADEYANAAVGRGSVTRCRR